MIYTPHYEVYVISVAESVMPMPPIASISPEQTEASARLAGEDLREVYGSMAQVKCLMHVCYHGEDGLSELPCTEEVLWQNP